MVDSLHICTYQVTSLDNCTHSNFKVMLLTYETNSMFVYCILWCTVTVFMSGGLPLRCASAAA